jgi:hypothetical protein
MKAHVNRYLLFSLLCSLVMISGCKNDDITRQSLRKLAFELFTDQDFSAETGTIIFKPVIIDNRTVLWDSTFAPMLIKEIPASINKIAFQKIIANNHSELKVGFEYTIVDVGTSGYYERAPDDGQFRKITFNFK